MEEGGSSLVHSLRAQSIMVGNARQQERKADGHIKAAVKN